MSSTAVSVFVVGIHKPIVVGMETDNIVEEAALAVE
jgi:hypothetical protein